MSNALSILLISAASLGFVHTVLGPDHYLPFTVMAKSGKWSMRKTVLITVACGVGHVVSSVVLGFLGIGFGVAVNRLVSIETARGTIAAWLLIGFGLVYMVWGIWRAIKNKPHSHIHVHADGAMHDHEHTHHKGHAHVHSKAGEANFSPWVLFTIFIFGPCEPLIPILMYPAAQDSVFGLVMVTLVFGLVTIATMVGVVLILTYGLNFIPSKGLERYSHALAGGTIFLSGLAVQFLGL